jgi:hypothetical protein
MTWIIQPEFSSQEALLFRPAALVAGSAGSPGLASATRKGCRSVNSTTPAPE